MEVRIFRGTCVVVAEWLMRWIVNPCLCTVGSNPTDHKKKGRSIIGNVFDLGSKDCGFEPHRPDLFGYSLVVE